MNLELTKIENSEHKSEICEKILRGLPKWFGIESAIIDYIKDVSNMDTWAAKVDDQIIGFVSLNKHNKFTAEIHVMGILEKYHRLGLGKKLIQVAEDSAAQEGLKFLQVKTLSVNRPDENYDKTRQFYLKTGFVPVEEFKTLWGEHNPCLLMIKSLTNKSTLLSHVEINVSDYAKSIRFYEMVLQPLGWERLVCQDTFTTFSDGSMKLVLSPVEDKFLKDGFHRKRIGLNHLAFYAQSEEQVDHLHKKFSESNIEFLYDGKPQGDSDYYAVFFEDPDRIKIEVVFAKGYCSPNHWTNKFEDNFDPYKGKK